MASSPGATWEAFCREGKLAYQLSTGLGQPVFYPRVVAPGTGADDLEWRTSRGRGTVYASTTVRRRDRAPYDVSLIDLDEGFRMMSRVKGVAPDEVVPGLRVVLSFEDAVPYFVPDGSAA